MSAKLGFAAGLAVGVLAGSRAGRGVYDKTAAAATAVAQDPRVRSGASAALHKAGSASSSVAGAAVRKVRERGKSDEGSEGEGAERGSGAESDRGDGELRKRGKRFGAGARRHGVRVNGHGASARNANSHRWSHMTHLNHWNHSRHGEPQAERPGMSAPSVQARPKGGDGRPDHAPSNGEA